MSTTRDPKAPRNPGPSWGCDFLNRADAILPRPLFDALLRAGTWVAVGLMPQERHYSRAYLNLVLGRPATLRDVWRHFFSFTLGLMVKMRVGAGRPHRCVLGRAPAGFLDLFHSSQPALLGTFHIGDSDMLGYLLGEFQRKVHMIRLKVGNSHDTRRLQRQFGQWVTFLWVNETDNLVFALKEAVQSGNTVAMECDRPGYSAKLEAFQFLGRRRWFPFSIYHLSLIFRLPVIFCVGVPGAAGESIVHGSPTFEPDDGPREANLERARRHFQEVLAGVECLLREHPFLWYNFIALNPEAPEPARAQP